MASRTETPRGGLLGVPARITSVQADMEGASLTLRLEGCVHPDDVGDMYRLMGRELWAVLAWGDHRPGEEHQ